MLRADPGEDRVMRWTRLHGPQRSVKHVRLTTVSSPTPLAFFLTVWRFVSPSPDVLRAAPAMQFLSSCWEDESWLAIHHGMKWPEDREADGKKTAEP